MSDQHRPNPDSILKLVQKEEHRNLKGRLRIFLGMSAGVGKTFAMLKAAHVRQNEGANVLIGVVETHGRAETMALVDSLKVLPRKKLNYKSVELEEMDIDAVLALSPDLVIVDELAHTNIPGSRHPKRYQDVLELIDAGIDVYTAINIQHLDSRKDLVEKITGVPIRETVPDSIFEIADQIEVVDITPNELLKRLKEGKVYLADRAERAAQNFFKVESLTALREMALRFTAERVDQELQTFHELKSSGDPWQSNERLMVAVSHSPYSEKLIRTTRRLAYNLEAPWFAVHVDTGEKLNPTDHDQLIKNINLARELKAEVVSTTDRNVPDALKRIARQKNITQMIVGRPQSSFLSDVFFGGSLLDRLVSNNWQTDIHVIRQDASPVTRGNSLKLNLNFSTGVIPYWNTLWLVVALSFMSGLLEPSTGYQVVGFVFLVGVLIVGWIGTLGPTVFAAALSALIWNFFFIPPRLLLQISKPEDLILCATFFIVAMITGTLTNRVRGQEILLREREERTNILYEVLKDISSSSGKEQFLERVVQRVGQVFDGDCGVILKNLNGKLTTDSRYQYVLKLSDKDVGVAQWSFENKKIAGWSTDTLTQAEALFIPLTGDVETAGVFVYRPKTRRKLNSDQENLLQSVCRQLGLSLERHFNQKRVAEAEKLKQSEQLHQTLLNSISHEMRTPLTAILGSAQALIDTATLKSEDLKQELAQEIVSASQRLNRVIENLLDMSRLNSGALALKKEWHSVEDLVGVTMSRAGKVLDGHRVSVDFPSGLPLVNIDFKLMEHAVSNLLFNAAFYTPQGSSIRVAATTIGPKLELSIEDDGPGIPAESLAHIFEKFYRVPGTPAGGTGLGLSIVRSIVEFHDGEIRVENRPSGGAKFVISLPVQDAPRLPENLND